MASTLERRLRRRNLPGCSTRTAGPQPRDVLRLAPPFWGEASEGGRSPPPSSLAWKIHERTGTTAQSATMARRGEFLGANMFAGRQLVRLFAEWQRNALDGDGRWSLGEDTALLVRREHQRTVELRSSRRRRGRSVATSTARGTLRASARRSDGPSAGPTRRA